MKWLFWTCRDISRLGTAGPARVIRNRAMQDERIFTGRHYETGKICYQIFLLSYLVILNSLFIIAHTIKIT